MPREQCRARHLAAPAKSNETMRAQTHFALVLVAALPSRGRDAPPTAATGGYRQQRRNGAAGGRAAPPRGVRHGACPRIGTWHTATTDSSLRLTPHLVPLPVRPKDTTRHRRRMRPGTVQPGPHDPTTDCVRFEATGRRISVPPSPGLCRSDHVGCAHAGPHGFVPLRLGLR